MKDILKNRRNFDATESSFALGAQRLQKSHYQSPVDQGIHNYAIYPELCHGHD